MDLATLHSARGPVALRPLSEEHREALRQAANADRDIWSIYPYCMADPHFDAFWAGLRASQADGARLPFAVLLDGQCVGISCYLDVQADQQAVEIGATYYQPSVRGGVVNPAAKWLMLGHAFTSGTRRVAFKVDALNLRSRAAVLKLGAVQEGVLRQDRVTWTGRVRDTVVFSILRDEWPEVEAGLLRRIAQG